MASQFTYRRRVEFCETDMAGIVHFANYYRYMEQAEHEFLRSLGLALMMTEPDGTVIGFPRVSSSCSYKAPARYDDVLEIRLRVDRKGVKSLTFAFEIFRGETHVANGQIKTVCCRFRPGQPMESIEIPPRYGDVIEEAPPRSAPSL